MATTWTTKEAAKERGCAPRSEPSVKSEVIPEADIREELSS
jgi:hypothetical protein